MLREVKFLEIWVFRLSYPQKACYSTLFSVSGNFLSRAVTFHSILSCFFVWPSLNSFSLLSHISNFYNTAWHFLLLSYLSIELVLKVLIMLILILFGIWIITDPGTFGLPKIWASWAPATSEEGWTAERVAQDSHYTDLMSFTKYTQVFNPLASSLCHALTKDFITFFFVLLQFHQIGNLILVSFPLIEIGKGF